MSVSPQKMRTVIVLLLLSALVVGLNTRPAEPSGKDKGIPVGVCACVCLCVLYMALTNSCVILLLTCTSFNLTVIPDYDAKRKLFGNETNDVQEGAVGG